MEASRDSFRSPGSRLTEISRNAHPRIKTPMAVPPILFVRCRSGRPAREENRPMETATLVPAAICHHARIRVATGRPMEFIDLTARIEALAAEAGIDAGLVNIQTLHTTTAIVVNEHEPLLLTDFEGLLARAAPRDGHYRHDDMDVRTVNLAPGERANGHAHCHALLLGSSVMLNFE